MGLWIDELMIFLVDELMSFWLMDLWIDELMIF